MSMHRYLRGAGRVSAGLLLLTIFAVFSLAAPAAAQDWFRTGTGLGVSKPKVAVADFVSRNDASASMAALFSDVVRNDLRSEEHTSELQSQFHLVCRLLLEKKKKKKKQ